MTEMIPGPWFSEPKWRKAYLWTRYVLLYKPRNVYSILRYYWGYYVTHRSLPKNKSGDKFPNKNSIVPSPKFISGILWRMEGDKTGRYYTMVDSKMDKE